MGQRNWTIALVAVVVATLGWFAGRGIGYPVAAPEPMVVHNVYFSLKDNSPEARKKLVEACRKYLTNHPGTVFFAAGVLSEELNRPVNDRDFDVGLHIVFKNRAAHDKYQDDPRHIKFIEEMKDNWKKVRVFDSDCLP